MHALPSIRAAILPLVAAGLLYASSGPARGDDSTRSGSAADAPTTQPVVSVSQLVRDAVSADPREARAAIAKLRAMGPDGLHALYDDNRELIARHLQSTPDAASDSSDAKWPRLCAALDAVVAQRNAYAANLYWYTDLDAAKAAAKASGKPILSLRLLGRLDEELSCANSRFFRTVLYANDQVSDRLRNDFILHWQSERPVPRITIDFGDGRKIERTITGNSIHYVLAADGRVIDAIPGLYGPLEFLTELNRAHQVADYVNKLPGGADPSQFLRRWHQTTEQTQLVRYQRELSSLSPTTAPSQVSSVPIPAAGASGQPHAAPPARVAGRVAMGKGVVERPMIAALDFNLQPANRDEEATWTKLASLHAAQCRLDEASIHLMAAKHHAAVETAPAAGESADADLEHLVGNFQRVLALDTVRIEYLLHTQIHHWLAADDSLREMEKLNTRVYAELFLTPRSDPWLGLAPADAYSALDSDGLSPAPTVAKVNADVRVAGTK